MNMVHLNINLNNLDIGIEFWDVRKCFLRIFLHTLDEHFSPISRNPDEMIFRFIDGMGTLSELHSTILAHTISSGYPLRLQTGV